MTTITKAIVLRAQQGDEGAERTIVDELQRPVIATIYRCLGPARGAEAEAIAQELFLDLFRNIGRFDARRMKFTTWVYELVRDRCADVLARQPGGIITKTLLFSYVRDLVISLEQRFMHQRVNALIRSS